MENERRVQQKAPASRYALLDELRGLVYRLAGAAVAAEHLLGVHPAVRLLRAAGTPHPEARRTGVCCRGTGHGGDAGLHAGGPGGVRCADLSGQRHAAHRCAGTAAEKIPPAAGLAVSAVLFALTYHLDERWLGFGGLRLALPDAWYANYFTAFFGFLPFDFYSTDYFALLPWLFLFWAGYFLHGVVGRARMEPLRRSVCPALGWMGRHSLLLYLLHQPVIYGVLSAAAVLFA